MPIEKNGSSESPSAASNVQHAQGSDRWFTPEDFVSAARQALGGVIDLDPASEPEAQRVVRAERWISEAEDGTRTRWIDPDGPPKTVFCNPPGKKDGATSPTTGKPTGRSLVWAFWETLMAEKAAGRLRAAIWVAFSLEQLQQSQLRARGEEGLFAMTDFMLCIPRRRIPFGSPEASGKKTQPSHANAIVYVSGVEDNPKDFAAAFRPFGSILVPAYW